MRRWHGGTDAAARMRRDTCGGTGEAGPVSRPAFRSIHPASGIPPHACRGTHTAPSVPRYQSRLVAILLALACHRADRAPRTAPPLFGAAGPGVRLIDSLVVQSDVGDRVLARVLLDSARADTIPGLLTTDLPTLVGDSVVLGLAVDAEGLPIGMFRYRLVSHRVETLSLPEALAAGASGVRVSPGGRWQAYVALDTSGVAQGVIQRFPNGPVLRRSPVVLVDWFGGRQAEVEWSDDDTAVFYVDAFRDGSGRWLRMRGGMDSGKWRVDTIAVRG